MRATAFAIALGFITSAASQSFWQPQCGSPHPDLRLTAPDFDECREILDILSFNSTERDICTSQGDTCISWSIDNNGYVYNCAISVCWLREDDPKWCVSERQAYHGLTALFDACDAEDNEAGTGWVRAGDMTFAVFAQNGARAMSSAQGQVQTEVDGVSGAVLIETTRDMSKKN